MTQDRWAPTLPTFGGRLAPRVNVSGLLESTYSSRLEEYYLQRQSCLGMFSRPVPERWLRKVGVLRGPKLAPTWFLDLESSFRFKYLMETLGKITMSLNFQRKLSALCKAGDVATIKRWWQTTDGVVLPLLMTVENPDNHYRDIDRLTKFSLENCANNYAQFISRLKTLRRLLRKDYALMTEGARSLSDIATYWKMYKKHFPTDGADPHRTVQYILCWAQTRATGLADSVMIRQSLLKCENTLKTPRRPDRVASPEFREYTCREQPAGVPVLPPDSLREISWRVADRLKGETAHISAGPNACLEATRQDGGQTGAIMRLARGNHLREVYNFRTLERETIRPRPIRSQSDLLSWAIQETLSHPTYVRCVRLHAVAEPSKARTITVGSLPYLVIVGVIAKLLQPAIASDITRTGLRASRNLWRFLFEDLDPNLGVWGWLRDKSGPASEPVLGLSSDLSEATDYGDLSVARQLLDRVLSSCSEVPGFPTGLGLLAKSLFIGKRYCFRHDDGRGYRFFTKRNGWLMGDRLTKVILTLVHEIVTISSGLHAVRICGDDVIAFSRDRRPLEKYLEEVQRLGFKVSEEDSYISSRLAFYCEEGCIPPQKFLELPAVAVRRQTQSCYIDYPRIRLLIPTCVETHSYSYTDVGRFALLGKETRWVHQSGQTQSLALFHRAGLLQHLNVPEPSDTMCPYLPIEIGGDGGFPPSSQFLKETVLWKSRNLPETLFRMKQLLTHKWGYRFVRSSNLNDTTHKYHLLVPKISELKALLPEEAIVEGNELLLGSIKVDGLEDPEKTFFRIQRAYYWHTILTTGMEPPELKLEVTRRHDDGADINLTDAEFAQFYNVWANTGFTFKDNPDYRVDTRYVHVHDYMNMGWWFGKPPIRGPRTTLSDIGGRKLLNEENIENFIEHIKSDEDLDPKVKEHLYKYVEADSYILHECSRRWDFGNAPKVVLLVSGDKKLAVQLARLLVSRQFGIAEKDTLPCVVGLVEPIHYMYGMLEPYEEWAKAFSDRVETVVDFGAVSFAAFTNSGVGVFYEEPRIFPVHLYRGKTAGELFAVQLVLDESSGRHETVSLTTQPGSQIRPGALK